MPEAHIINLSIYNGGWSCEGAVGPVGTSLAGWENSMVNWSATHQPTFFTLFLGSLPVGCVFAFLGDPADLSPGSVDQGEAL